MEVGLEASEEGPKGPAPPHRQGRTSSRGDRRLGRQAYHYKGNSSR